MFFSFEFTDYSRFPSHANFLYCVLYFAYDCKPAINYHKHCQRRNQLPAGNLISYIIARRCQTENEIDPRLSALPVSSKCSILVIDKFTCGAQSGTDSLAYAANRLAINNYLLISDGPDSATLLGTLDTAFLLSYGVTMFASGFVAERVSLRYFLTLGMLFSGIFTYLFGMAKVYDIHSMWYFIAVQVVAGIFQTTGWPGVVTVIGRWFGKAKRGLIFGIWNSHTSIGNILGTLIAAHYVESDWSMSFIVPGLIMGIFGFILFLFLVDSPEIVGCQERESRRNSTQSNYSTNEVSRTALDGDGHTQNDNETNVVIVQVFAIISLPRS